MRSSSELSYRGRINSVADYIGANLAESLDGSVLARQAALSPFHFHRVFHELTGLTPAEYVEYARLGTAIVRLRQTDRPISRVAESVGYETGASLAKAMRRRFGVVPSRLRAENNENQAGHRLDLSAFLRPKPPGRLSPRLVHLPPRLALCTTEHGMQNHQGYKAFSRAQALLNEEAEQLGLARYIQSTLVLISNAPANPDDQDFQIIVGLLIDKPGLTVQPTSQRTRFESLGGGNYAVFRQMGTYETHWQSWFSIFHNWVPSVAALLRPGFPFQCAVEEEPGKPSRILTDFYLPIV